MGFLDQLSKSATEAGEYLTEKAVLAKDYAMATMDISEAKSRINSIYKELGKMVYNANRKQIDSSADMERLMAELDQLKAAITEKEKVRNRALCPACDESIDASSCFCPHCGAKIK